MKRAKNFLIKTSLALAATTVMSGAVFAQSSVWFQEREFQRRPLEPNLANKMRGDFTAAFVGDMLIQEPFGKTLHPDLVKVLRDADVTIGNMETIVYDHLNSKEPRGGGGNWTIKETAKDLADLGFDLVSHANNHGLDMGIQGTFDSMQHLSDAGIKAAGFGKNQADAGRAAYHHTPKGRVGLVGVYVISEVSGSPRMCATDKFNNIGGTPGLNCLELVTWNVVNDEQFKAIKDIEAGIIARREEVLPHAINMPKLQPDRAHIFLNGRFKPGPKTGEYQYEAKKDDMQRLMTQVRQAKEYGDFVALVPHIHQNSTAFKSWGWDWDVLDIEREIAHGAIDNGADVYSADGIHNFKGIEIYKGKHGNTGIIFYGLNKFSFHQILPETEAGSFTREGEDPFNSAKTAIEVNEWDNERRNQARTLVGAIGEVKYRNGQPYEIRLHPMDLGMDLNRPWSRQGTPEKPTPENARKILEQIQRESAKLGTKVTIENGIGIVRL
ncbi:MAG: hypothetical protein ABS87_04130 [Sphingomonas sp. SCN 67-18]|nr:MAG: hypothetical protein ABS87_04130 [Sphingomonas sp. SCN 67-18]